MQEFISFVSFQSELIVTACMTPREFCANGKIRIIWIEIKFLLKLIKAAHIIARKEMQSTLLEHCND